MTDRDPLFREEAVREYVEARVQGRLLRLSSAWTNWVYWLMLATCTGGLLFASVVEIDQWTTGTAIVRGDGTVLALFDARSRDDLRAGGTLVLRFLRSREVTIEATPEEILGRSRLRELYGPVDESIDVTGPVVVVRASLGDADSTSGAVPGLTGRAEVRSGRATLLETFLREAF